MPTRFKPYTLALAAAFVVALSSAAAQAQAPNKMKQCADQWNEMKAKNQTGDQTYQQFSKKCMSADDDTPAAKPSTATTAPAAKPAAAPTTTTAPAAKPSAAKPTPASAKKDDDEEEGTAKEDLAKCNASWKDYKTKNNVSGAKAWHVYMARCLP